MLMVSIKAKGCHRCANIRVSILSRIDNSYFKLLILGKTTANNNHSFKITDLRCQSWAVDNRKGSFLGNIGAAMEKVKKACVVD